MDHPEIKERDTWMEQLHARVEAEMARTGEGYVETFRKLNRLEPNPADEQWPEGTLDSLADDIDADVRAALKQLRS